MKSHKSTTSKISPEKAFKLLGLPRSASFDELNRVYKSKLDEIQKRNADQPDKLVPEADELYRAYRAAYLSKEGANEDDILPLTITGPETLLDMFGLSDVPQRNMKVQMQTQAQYKDGQLIKKQNAKTESFINKDGKRETKVYENGQLIKHTIDGKDQLNK